MKDGTLASAGLIGATPGRSLAFSPRWTDDGMSVVFDRNSGDYWVLTDAARMLVECVAGGEAPPLSLDALAARAADAGTAVDQVADLIDELIHVGILGIRADLPPTAATRAAD